MSEPQVPPPKQKKSLLWPVAINLGLLVLIAGFTGINAEALAIGVAALAVVNTIAAVGLSGRMHYVVAFVFSALVVMLVGLGICALLFSGVGGQH